MPHTLAGQVALITGAGRGIGRAVAEMLARAGVCVVAAARSAHEVQATVERLRELEAEALGVACDIALAEDVRHLVDQAVDQFGTIDIVINNAGLLQPVGMAWDVEPDEWVYAVHVNLVAPFRVCHAVLPLMIEEGGGRIINVSTGAARYVVPGWSAYGSSKAGLDHLTRILAAEVQPHGVTVNAVHPGVTDTRMQADIRRLSEEQFPSVEHFRQRHAGGELRDPAEPAELIFWLCTAAARDVTGQILDINDAAVRDRVARDLGRPPLPGPDRQG